VECRYCSPFLMDRMIGIPAIKFVGKGFHGTDYTRFGPKKKG
jgi:predicted nucleic acid-binding Zn ribbon protein